MTASSLSRLPASVGGDWTLSRMVDTARVASGAVLVAAILLATVTSGTASTFDPGLVLLFSVVVGAALGGVRGGVIAAAVAAAGGLVYYAQPAWAVTPGNVARALLLVGTAAMTMALVGGVRQAADHLRGRFGTRRGWTDGVRSFTVTLSDAPDESVLEQIAGAARALVDADAVVLTVPDQRSRRHVVRAVHGSATSAIGVEVLPGVGIIGQAIRDRRLVVSGGPRLEPAPASTVKRLSEQLPPSRIHQLTRRPAESGLSRAPVGGAPRAQVVGRIRSDGGLGGRPVASLPALHGGRVVATLTVGRNNGRPPFGESERVALEIVGPIIALTIDNWLLRRRLHETAIRDRLSGLYNRAYFDAALEQLLALRRRTPPNERPPLSIILFDLDDFRAFNERHGRKSGDAVIRAVGGFLRQRFRASDLLARTSGDGFIVVLEDVDLDVAARAAADVRGRVGALAVADERGTALRPSISAGCATFSDDDERSEAIIRAVEAALDTARWSGPGAIVSI